MHYRNSDLSVNRYFTKFKDDINEAKKHGKEVFYNEVRKKNNCYHARRLQGDVCIKDIFMRYWPEFKERHADRLQRPGLIESIDKFVGCHDFENGYLYFECPNCNEFYMMGFSCHSRICPSCGKKYRDRRTIKVSEKCLEIPRRQFVFTVPFQLRNYFRLYRKPLLNALFKSVEDAFNALLKNHAPIAYKVIHVEFPDVVSLVDAAFENEVQSMRIWIAIGVEAPDDDLVDCGLEYLPLEHANPLLQSKTYR